VRGRETNISFRMDGPDAVDVVLIVGGAFEASWREPHRHVVPKGFEFSCRAFEGLNSLHLAMRAWRENDWRFFSAEIDTARGRFVLGIPGDPPYLDVRQRLHPFPGRD